MIVFKLYNTQALLWFIFLYNHLSLKCVSSECYHDMYSTFGRCLKYKQLGQKCSHSIQCSKTLNAVCYNKNYKKLDGPLIFHRVIEDYDYKYESDRHGECKCMIGYKISAKNECEKIKLKDALCHNSSDCSHHYENTYCNQSTKKCNCDNLYIYDPNTDSCVFDLRLVFNKDREYETNLINQSDTEETIGYDVLKFSLIIVVSIFIVLICLPLYSGCKQKRRTLSLSEPEDEVDVPSADSTNLQTVTENDMNECYSQSVTSPPSYNVVATDQQPPTYEQAISMDQIQQKN